MYATFGKRILDLLIAIPALVVLFPIMLLVALWIKLESKGPVLFRQKRTGLHGEVFSMYKFRSMSSDNDVHDTRCRDKVTKVGKILRATSLDELPQLINVVRGDMSIIGPRPWITSYYENMNEKQRRRNSVHPGVTGLAQAYGRNNLTIYEKINYDLQYANNVSLRGDIKVVAMTVKTLFDHEAHELGKGGIHEELAELKSQNHGTITKKKQIG